MDDVWRVDDDLLTVVKVPREKLHKDCPLGCWLPAMIGAGSYVYVENEDAANAVLKNIISNQVKVLTDRLKELA